MKNGKTRLFLFHFMTVFILLPQCVSSTGLIPPSDPDINYYGRVDFTDPSIPRYCWSGVIIEAAFTGSTIGMKIDHNNSYYDIEVDDTFDTLIHVTRPGEYIFTGSLPEGNHTVKIKLRSEDHYTAASFQGLLIAEEGDILSAPAKPSRKIEFLGDSYTAGYGVESPGRECTPDTNKRFTNAHSTFAARVTKAFHAQSVILGWSGAGLVKNYDPPTTNKRSPNPFPFYYDRILEENNEKPWDYTKWIPELVVICLGTNDYTHNRNPGSNPAPDDSMYIGDYHKFIARILRNYPDASILCVSTGDATFEKNVKTVVSEQHSIHENPKVFFAPYPSSMENTGCDWHPNVKDNNRVADVLIDTIMEKLGWDTAAVTAVRSRAPKEQMLEHAGFRIIRSRNRLVLRPAGKTILSKSFDSNGACTIPLSALRGDVFIIGNARIGWIRLINYHG